MEPSMQIILKNAWMLKVLHVTANANMNIYV